jgi:hypothetical protein
MRSSGGSSARRDPRPLAPRGHARRTALAARDVRERRLVLDDLARRVAPYPPLRREGRAHDGRLAGSRLETTCSTTCRCLVAFRRVDGTTLYREALVEVGQPVNPDGPGWIGPG